MKRVIAVLAAMMLLCLPVTAQAAFSYVTDFDYALIRSGGIDGAFVYGAYENDGANYTMGLLTEDGEQSRTDWTADGWSALFAASDWAVTVHGDAGELCPYANTHKDSTLCPYLNVSLVTLTNLQSGVALENYYMQNSNLHISTGSTIHLCFGNYVYTSPETLKWDGESTNIAICDEQGCWGVVDALTGEMLTPFAYEAMSAVYGDYAKVSNGTAWGRLDVSGATETAYMYDSADDFSVTEELREIADGQWRVFNADNEPLSVIYDSTAQALTYAADAHCVLSVADDGTKTLLDLTGETVATFDATQKVLHLDRTCYAIEQYNDSGAVVGVALASVAGVPEPNDTVLLGDVNLDGSVDSADARLILRHILGLQDLTQRQAFAADLTADGVVNSSDARALLLNMTQT